MGGVAASMQRAFTRLAADTQRVFGTRFVALVAYDATASLAFASEVHADDLDALSALVEQWHRDGLAPPLVMTPDEFRRSLDAFPLEYQAILDRHVVVAGTPPFDGIFIEPDDLRRACETQARSHLIHLRQGWIQHAAHEDALAELLVRSAGPFRALLSSLARLHGRAHQSDGDLTSFAEAAIGVPAALVRAVLELDAHGERGLETLPRLEEYLRAAERLWTFIDTWQKT